MVMAKGKEVHQYLAAQELTVSRGHAEQFPNPASQGLLVTSLKEHSNLRHSSLQSQQYSTTGRD